MLLIITIPIQSHSSDKTGYWELLWCIFMIKYLCINLSIYIILKLFPIQTKVNMLSIQLGELLRFKSVEILNWNNVLFA